MNQKNKKIVLTFILFLLTSFLLTSNITSALLQKTNLNHETPSSTTIQHTTITLTANPYEITNDNQGISHITMDGFGSLLQPGLPKLPTKTMHILLPKNSTVLDITLINQTKETLSEEYTLKTAPFIFNSTITKNNLSKTNQITTNLYPSNNYEFIGTGQYNKAHYAKIRFTPFCYNLNEKTLTYYKEITLNISYQTNQKTLIPQNTIGNDITSQVTENQQFLSTTTNQKPLQNTATYEYIIITTPELEQSVLFLQQWRELTGFSTKMVNTTWIMENYQGIDLQQQIRSFLKDVYSSWNVKYVLLVGSIDTIPMRDCYPNRNNHGYYGKTPTDYYYADLTGNWDRDNDGYFGERIDDNQDFTAEVIVGRIPVDDPETVDSICQKIIEFEKNDGEWKQDALMIGALLFLENQYNDQSYEKTDGATVMEEVWKKIYSPNDFQRTTLYEQEGLTTSDYTSDYALTKDNVLNQITKGYGLVNWNAHGSSTATSRVVWNSDDGDNIPEATEIDSPYFISSYDTVSFSNEKPSIVFSCSCQNAYPEKNNNLGASLLTNGAVSFIGATRNAWGSIGWKDVSDGGASSIDYLFSQQLISEEKPVGKALYHAKFDYVSMYDWGGWETYQNMYDFNLYGDPATSFQTITGLSEPTTPVKPSCDITGPIYSELQFSTKASDPDYHQLYYKWDWDDGTSSTWLGPYNSDQTIQTSHQWRQPGTYNVKVLVRDSTGSSSNYSEEISITITAPNIQIESITGNLGTIKITLKNTGDYKASGIDWSIDLDEGFILNSQSQGTIPSIDIGETIIFKHRFIIGFGIPVLTIQYASKRVDQEKVTTAAIIIGPTIIV